ncbi:MAG: hypothetical protein DRG78_03405 [Epsilonproteobacteria bacterium]|nr:MAG: hypothetical protein DRG78_03405 [Campylobacterota bacterium]
MANNYLIAKEFKGSQIQTKITIKQFQRNIVTKPKFDMGSFYFKQIKPKYNKAEYELFKHIIQSTPINELFKTPPLKFKKQIGLINDFHRVLKKQLDVDMFIDVNTYSYFNYFNWNLQTVFLELTKVNNTYLEVSKAIADFITKNQLTQDNISDIVTYLTGKYQPIKLNRFIHSIYYKLSETNLILFPDSNLVFGLLYNDTDMKRFHKVFLTNFVEVEVSGIVPKKLKPVSAKISQFIDSQLLFLATNFSSIDVAKITSIKTYKNQQLRTYKYKPDVFFEAKT